MRLLVLLAALMLAACAEQSDPGVTVLTYATPYAPGHPFSRADRDWIEWIERESSGRLRIVPFWSGSVLSSEHSMTELRHGLVDIGTITPIYARGGAHLHRAQSGFYGGTSTIRQQLALYRCMQAADPQFARELHGLKVLAVQGGNLPGIVTRDRPVRRLEDLQGLRLRAPSELLSVLRHLGADPVDMPMSEVYSALAKGILDGVIAPADTLRSLHFAEVARYFNTMDIPRGAYASRAMSERRWQSLDAGQRELLERGIEMWERALEANILAAEEAGLRAGREHNVVFHQMPAEDLARFQEIYEDDAEARARSLARYGIDALQTFRLARKLASGITETGEIHCTGSSNEPTA